VRTQGLSDWSALVACVFSGHGAEPQGAVTT